MSRNVTWSKRGVLVLTVALVALVAIEVVALRGCAVAGLHKRDRIMLLTVMSLDASEELQRTDHVSDEKLIGLINSRLRAMETSLSVYRSQPEVWSGLIVSRSRDEDHHVLYFINTIERKAYEVSSNGRDGLEKAEVDAVLARENMQLLWIGRE